MFTRCEFIFGELYGIFSILTHAGCTLQKGPDPFHGKGLLQLATAADE
jgi:hypothetical protein